MVFEYLQEVVSLACGVVHAKLFKRPHLQCIRFFFAESFQFDGIFWYGSSNALVDVAYASFFFLKVAVGVL